MKRTPRKGMSSNGANGPTQRPRVGNVGPCYWLSNRWAKTRHITSQSWAAVGAPRRWASFVAAQASAKVPPWICSDHRASRDCVIATGQPSYWRWMATFGTMFWRSALERRQTEHALTHNNPGSVSGEWGHPGSSAKSLSAHSRGGAVDLPGSANRPITVVHGPVRRRSHSRQRAQVGAN